MISGYRSIFGESSYKNAYSCDNLLVGHRQYHSLDCRGPDIRWSRWPSRKQYVVIRKKLSLNQTKPVCKNGED